MNTHISTATPTQAHRHTYIKQVDDHTSWLHESNPKPADNSTWFSCKQSYLRPHFFLPSAAYCSLQITTVNYLTLTNVYFHSRYVPAHEWGKESPRNQGLDCIHANSQRSSYVQCRHLTKQFSWHGRLGEAIVQCSALHWMHSATLH